MSIITNLYACKGFMVLGLWVGCAIFLSPQPAKSQLLKPASPYVPGRYIVLFHEGHAESVPGVITQMSAEIGLHVVHHYDGQGFAGHLSDSALARLRNDPRVAHIEQDQEVRIQAQPDGQRIRTAKGVPSNLVKPKPKAAPVRNSQTIPWGITRINAGNSSTKSGDGAGSVDIDVAVIDTGIDLKHPDLKIVGGKNFTNGGISNYGDGYGHGTHVSGIIAAMDNTIGVVGVAPGARLWSVRVMDNTGSGYMSGVIAGVNYVTSNARTIKIANMSLDGGESKALQMAIDKAVAAGVTVVGAAGNESTDCRTSCPANSINTGFITASALDLDGNLADYSNYGRNYQDDGGAENGVDVIAPGSNIYSTYKGGTYATLSGSSMATAYVTGVAALCKVANPSFKPDQIRASLMRSAPPSFLGTSGKAIFGISPWSAAKGDPDNFYEPLVNAGAY